MKLYRSRVLQAFLLVFVLSQIVLLPSAAHAQDVQCPNPNTGRGGTPAERAARFEASAETAANATPPDPCLINFLSRAAGLTATPGTQSIGDEHPIALLRTAVANGESVWGANSVKLVPFLLELGHELSRTPLPGQTLADQSRVAEAEGLIQRAITLTENVYGPDDIHDAGLVGELAMVTANESVPPTSYAAHTAKVAAIFEHQLAIEEKAWGANDFRITATLWRLAAEYSNEKLACSMPYSGRQLSPQEFADCTNRSLSKADPILERDVQIIKATPGPGGVNASLDLPLDMLARDYSSEHKYTEEQNVYRQMIDVDAASGPQPNPKLVSDYQNLASAYQNVQDNASAREILLKALDIAMQQPPFKTPSLYVPPVSSVLMSLGALELRENDFADAREHFQKALDAASKDAPPNSFGIIQIAYATAGRYMGPLPEESLALYQKVISTIETNPPATSNPGADFQVRSDYLISLQNSAIILQRLQRDAEAGPIWEKLIAAAQQSAQWKFQLLGAMQNYAQWLLRQNRLGDAQSKLQQLIALTKGDASFQTQYATALHTEADLLRQMNMPDDAAKAEAQAKTVEAANAAAANAAQ